MHLETERLLLRKHEQIDFNRFWELVTDPIGKQYTGGTTKLTYEDRFKLYQEEYLQPFNDKWVELAIIEKEKNIYLGYCGMRYIEELGEYEFFYGLHQDSWRKGYAFEAGKVFLNYLFQTYSHQAYCAIVEAENIASKKLLDKLGFQLVKQITDENEKILDYYLMEKPFI